jgi:hypothetical protein
VLHAANATSASHARSAVLWTVELELLSISVGYNYREMAWHTEPEWNARATGELNVHVDVLSSVAKDLVYGSEARQLQSLAATSASAYRLFLVDGCVDNSVSAAECADFGGPSSYYGCNNYYRLASCRHDPASTNRSSAVFYYGIVGRGLFPALLQLTLVVRRAVTDQMALLAQGPGALVYISADHAPAGSRLSAPGDFVNQCASSFLAAGLGELSASVLAESVALVSASLAADALAAALSSAALLLIFAFKYRPLIAQLDRDIKRSRHLLLLIPDAIAKVVPAVVQAGQRLAAASADA